MAEQTQGKPAILIELHENEREILAAMERAHQRLVRERFINISHSSILPTVMYEAFRALFEVAVENKSETENVTVDFAKLFQLGVTYLAVEDGEKSGNFTPIMIPGKEMRLMAKDDATTEL